MANLKCKHCPHTAPDLPELRQHVRAEHKTEWQAHLQNMETWDNDHIHELGHDCPICSHRKPSHGRS